MARFITLAGRKQVGKDTSAQYIKQLIEGSSQSRVHIVHFADALKQACSIIFGISLEEMETETGKQRLTEIAWPQDPGYGYQYTPWPEGCEDSARFMTVREILQFVGTNLFRNQLDPDIWVKSVYRKKYRDDDVVVVADCRFPNEAEFARANGILIGVERDTGLESDGHPSETALDGYVGYHHRIINNGSFGQLREQLRAILESNSLTV